MAFKGLRSSWLILDRKSDLARLAFSATDLALQFHILFLQYLIQTVAFGDVAGSGKHALQLSIPVIESGRIVRHNRFLAVPGSYSELVIGYFFYLLNTNLMLISARSGLVK